METLSNESGNLPGLNLFYLFNEGDLYRVEEELPPLRKYAATVPSAEVPVVVPEPVVTDAPIAAKLAEAPQPTLEAPGLEVVIVSSTTTAEPPVAVEVPQPQPEASPAPVAEAPAVINELPPKEVLQPSSPVLLIVREPRAARLNVYDEAFLEKVLQAVNLSLSQVTLVNVSGVESPDYYYLFKEKKIRHFISFGVPLEELNLYLPLLPYEVKPIHGIQFLYTDSLEGIRTDIERKKWLWVALKQLFGS
jgi:hypothetical protein